MYPFKKGLFNPRPTWRRIEDRLRSVGLAPQSDRELYVCHRLRSDPMGALLGTMKDVSVDGPKFTAPLCKREINETKPPTGAKQILSVHTRPCWYWGGA